MPNVGCLILAGGQGTRLGHAGPKGTFEIAGKSLFERVALRARGPVAVMTSPLNDAQTRAFFRYHRNFGLPDLGFVVQEMLPFLGHEHTPLREESPAGNGWALKHLVDQGIADAWEAVGITAVNTVQVDNVLAKPHDSELASYGVDVAMRCTERTGSEERVGVVVEGPRVVEYSELTDELRDVQAYPLANLGIFCFSLSFAREVARRCEEMPLHLAYRATADGTMAYKQERFLFDCLPWASTSKVIVSDRKSCFMPLKSPMDAIAAKAHFV